jgi:hypothetical protein
MAGTIVRHPASCFTHYTGHTTKPLPAGHVASADHRRRWKPCWQTHETAKMALPPSTIQRKQEPFGDLGESARQKCRYTLHGDDPEPSSRSTRHILITRPGANRRGTPLYETLRWLERLARKKIYGCRIGTLARIT